MMLVMLFVETVGLTRILNQLPGLDSRYGDRECKNDPTVTQHRELR
jgi:hypothetical protein